MTSKSFEDINIVSNIKSFTQIKHFSNKLVYYSEIVSCKQMRLGLVWFGLSECQKSQPGKSVSMEGVTWGGAGGGVGSKHEVSR